MKKWLSGFLALTMLLSMCVFAPAVSAETDVVEDPVVSRFVVVSDVHTNPVSPTKTIDRLPKVFSTAYAYAESQGGTIDAFVFNGDSINGNETASGYTNEAEFELFFQGVKDNIKSESKALFAMARTHDIYDGDGNIYYITESELNGIIADKLGTDGSIIPTADWGYGPHLTKVNGIPVITLTNDIGNGNEINAEDDGNTGNDDNADNSYHDSEAWLDTTMASLVAENPEQPIFVVFHYPEVGKLGWTQRWGQNSLRDTLDKYPQAIAVNAHVHWDPRNVDSITQDRFTEVYDGAIRDAGGWGADSSIVSYSMIEVTESGAVSIKYIDPETGNFLQEANGSGEILEYSIPKAWDRSTYLYTDEAKYAVDEAVFAEDAFMTLQNGKLTFDRADSEHPIVRYRVDVSDGKTTKSTTVDSEMLGSTLPETYSTTLALKTGIDYTITVTAIDGLFRDSANTLTLTCNISDPAKALNGSATAIVEKTYAGNGTKGEYDYPDFKTYATNPDAEGITNWGISDIEDLKAWSDFSKSNNCSALTFHLENDIDMKDEPFGMIGSIYVPFEGKFDGHLYTISNLLIDDTSGMGTGFFVYLKNAEIKNFGIESGLVRGHVSNRKYENAGTYNVSGTKRNSFLDVIGVAAIAGRADNTDFTHVWNKADVTFRESHMTVSAGFSEACSAGLVGRAQNNCTFVGCYNTGDVYGLNRASGITNWAQNGTYIAQISNCFNLGTITTETDANTEAIARYNSVNSSDLAYFNYNNYYLEGSADIATNRASDTGYTANGAEEAIVLTAEEVTTDLADLLNAGRFTGLYADTATWATDENGNIYIASLEDDAAEKIISISSPEDLNTFAANSKSNSYEGYTVVLKSNLDMSGTANFAMIGSESVPFKGTFIGNGYTISNLKIASGAKIGLFVQITDGTVKDLTISGVNLTDVNNCGILAYKLSGNVLIQNVHIKNSSIVANNHQNGGFAAAVVNGGSYKIYDCTIDGLVVDGLTNSKQQSAGFVAGAGYGVEIDSCIITNSTVSAHRNAGLIVSYANGTTVKNLISYGNTLKCNYNSIGLIGGQLQNPTTLENCVFYPTAGMQNISGSDTTTEKNGTTFTLFGYQKLDKEVTATNVFTTAASDTTSTATVISTTEAKLNSGEVAHTIGWTMKDGYVAFLEKGDEPTHCYTYVMGETTEVRYTDSTGAVINDAPEVTTEDFLGWTVTDGEKAGDKVYTAAYGTEDTGSYPISEFANRPKATKFTVSTPEELNYLAELSKTYTFEGYTITLLNDIDMIGTENFAMLGSSTCRFTANFDGGNHTIYNVKVNSTAAYAGFFSMTGVDKTKNVTIKDLTLEDAYVTGGESSAILIGKAYGVTLLENVKLRYSTAIGTNTAIGGFFGKVDSNTASFTVKNCVAESCKVSNLSASKQQAGLIVGSYPYKVSVEDCLLVRNTVEAHRQVGLISGFTTNNLTINGVIAYGNTINCNYDSAGIIGRASGTFDAQNIIAYNNSGLRNKSGSDTITAKNSTVYWMLGRYASDTPTVTGSNVYSDVENDTTLDPVAVTTVTAAQIESGEVAYKLGFAMEDGNIAFPDSDTKAAVKYTYIANAEVIATRYTDGAGNVIGGEVALPEGFDAWTVTDDENGDKTFSVANEYDPDGIYPITELDLYPLATKFSVSTAAEFKAFADLVNAGKIGSDLTIYQTADIDLKDYPNIEIGTGRNTDVAQVVAFEAIYDGQNHKISNYSLTATTFAHGMFKNLAGTVKNLVIENATVKTKSHSGILVGETYGTTNLIENVHIRNSTITASERRVAFFAYGYYGSGATVNIKNCTVSGSTLNTGTTANPIGLITIRDEVQGSVIENTYAFNNTINLQADGVAVSGIVADGRLTAITNCGAFNNTYTGATTSTIYGINGTSQTTATINNCYTDEAKLTNKTYNGSNNYVAVADAEIADGSLAYTLKTTSEANWVQKDGYAQVASGSAVTKVTYIVDGETYATAYTDYTGAQIGGETALPEGAEKWYLVDEVNGDKTYKTVTAYDANGTYPIADFELYTNARKFTISSEADLNKLATLSKSSNLSGYTFTLTDNIDMSNTENFAMIGVGDNSDTCFAGTFDGAGYTISNLKINSTAQIAMFLPKNATIKNFTLLNADVRGGRYSGIVIGSAAATTVSDVHIVGAYFNPNDDSRTYGGIAGYAYNATRAGAISTFTRCSVEDSEFDCAPNGGVGLIIGEMCAGTMTDCYAINNTLKALNRSGILIGYSYGVTIDGCFTYGNTMIAQEGKDITYPSGIAVGQVQTSATTVKNSIFCESDWDVYGYIASGSITFENCYTLCAAATAGTVATAEQLSSGELGYKTGIAMKDGKLILADADHAAPVKYTYVVNEETVAVLYTDYAGVTIGTVADPEMDGYTFDGWTESADGEAGDKLFTTTFSSNLNADVNGDNETNSADVIALLQYFNGDTAIDTEVADVNGDGKVSLADALRLMKLLTA